MVEEQGDGIAVTHHFQYLYLIVCRGISDTPDKITVSETEIYPDRPLFVCNCFPYRIKYPFGNPSLVWSIVRPARHWRLVIMSCDQKQT